MPGIVREMVTAEDRVSMGGMRKGWRAVPARELDKWLGMPVGETLVLLSKRKLARLECCPKGWF